MPFLAYYGCSKLLKARAVFYWGTHTRFTVSVGIDLSLAKTRRTRSADCICMDKRARISPLWEIVYYSDTCIVYLAEHETEYFTEILRNIPRMREQWCPGRFSLPRKKRPATIPRSQAVFAGARKKRPGHHCWSMRVVPIKTWEFVHVCTLSAYTLVISRNISVHDYECLNVLLQLRER